MNRAPALVALLALSLTAGAAWGQPQKQAAYPFRVPPLEIYDRLVRVGVGSAEPIPAADAKLLADYWAARTARPPVAVPLADAPAVTLFLIASGVPERDRAAYLAKFDELVAAAGRAVAGAKTDRERADRLLRFLHDGVLAKGYAGDETTLHGVFDTCKFNCVSSSSVYFLVGTRLGLRLQPVLIPGAPYQVGHAAVDLMDGKARVQIEPTKRNGYDWPAKLKQPGVTVIGPQPDRKKAYDTDGFGLAGAIASNLGIGGQKARAVRSLAVALVLAPTDPTATNNMKAAVSNWGLKEKEAKRYEDAVALFALGRAALGDKDKVEHNYRVVWEHYLDETFGAGRFEDGLKLGRRAAAAFPQDRRFAAPAEWVSRAASRKSKSEGWGAGLAFADAALKHLTEDAARGVRAWKSIARRQWSQQRLDAGDADGSLKALADGLTEEPGDRELLDGLAFHTQKALAVLGRRDAPAALAHFQELCERFPRNKEVRETGFRHAAGVVQGLAQAKRFDEALKAADVHAPLAGDRVGEVRAIAYDLWGQSLAAGGKWEEALAKYAEGLKACPKDKRLGTNSIAAVDQWAGKSVKSKDWREAVRIYRLGLTHFPDNSHLKSKLRYCESR